MNLRRIAPAALFASGALVWQAPPSAALVRPFMDVEVDYLAGRHHVCAEGYLRGSAASITGSWSFAIFGRRANGSEINFADAGFGSTYPQTCFDVYKIVDQGVYTVRFVYTGAGLDFDLQDGQPHPMAVGGIGMWTPGDNQFITNS